MQGKQPHPNAVMETFHTAFDDINNEVYGILLKLCRLKYYLIY